VKAWAIQEVKKIGRLDRFDPDDLAQTVIMKVFARFRAVPFAASGPGGFRAYVRQCVRHAAVDALRSAETGSRGVQLAPELWNKIEASIDSLADRFDTAWAQNVAQLREAVGKVQQRVGAARWEAFRLTVVEGCKGAQVATRLGLTPSQVYNAKHDITAYLREELAALGYGEPGA
jgi:RNA polymerase sigma factor (sigma-70 family)